MNEEKILPNGWDNTELKNVIIKAAKVKSKEKNQDEEFIYIDIGSIDNVIKKVPPQGAGYGKRFARKPLVSIASLYFPPQGAGNYTQIIIKQNYKL